jgi:hypothetical protein
VPNYFVVVKRERPELLDLLRRAFQQREGFTVVQDRRLEATLEPEAEPDRRSKEVGWAGDFLVAERTGLLD